MSRLPVTQRQRHGAAEDIKRMEQRTLFAPTAPEALEYVRIAADNSNDIITIATASDDDRTDVPRFLYVNEGCAKLFGYSVSEVVGSSVTMFDGPGTDRAELVEWLGRSSLNDSHTSELLQYRKDGTALWVEIRLHKVRTKVNGRIVFVGVGRDITERRQARARIEHLERTDSLTGLLVREAFVEQLQSQATNSAANGRLTAALHVDVDAFKDVNEFYGRATADNVLVALAQRLRHTLRSVDLIARQNGDEFLIGMPSIDSAFVAADAANRIRAALESPIHVDGHEISISLTIGLSVHPTDASDVCTLLRNANTALNTARTDGGPRFRFYSSNMHDLIVNRLALIQDLRRAVADDQLQVYYQPVVSLSTNSVVGAEALVRWNHPTRGLLGPHAFLSLAQESGVMPEIGRHVLTTATAAARRWSSLGAGDLQIAVNLSPRELIVPGLADSVMRALEKTDLEPRRLLIEVTESAVFTETSIALLALDTLRSKGVGIALDDFGTGYSSLSWLHRLPRDMVKIDKSFIEELTSAPFEQTMAGVIVGLCKRLGLTVCAEGVETAEQASLLRQHRCDLAQGFYYGRPMLETDFLRFLSARIARRVS